MDETGDLNPFIGAWEEFKKKYHIIFEKLVKILILKI